MLQDKRDFFVARINAGYYRFKIQNTLLYVFAPTPSIEYEACEVFQDAYGFGCEWGLLTTEDSYQALYNRDIWTERNENDLETAPKNIETLKVELYKAAFKSNTRAKIRERLEITREEHERLIGLKNSLVPYTCEGLANYAKWNYIIENTTYYPDGTPCDWESFSIHEIMGAYNETILTVEELRYLARTEPWSGMWVLKKKNNHIFDEPWTVEQKTLVNWSLLYDNVSESPESPVQEVIDDDDMLDGWLIMKRREREHEQTKKQGEEAITQNQKIANSAEIFIPVETPQDAQKIAELNTERSRSIRRNRFKQIEEQGSVKHGQLIDVRKAHNIEARQAYLDKMKQNRG